MMIGMAEQTFVSSVNSGKDGRLLWYVLGGVVVLAIVLGAIVFWYGNNLASDNNKPAPTPVSVKKTPNPTVPATVAPVASLMPSLAPSIAPSTSPSATAAAINIVTSTTAPSASASASVKSLTLASVKPSATASASVKPRVVPVDTSSGVPVTGVIDDTLKAVGIGVGMFVLGLLLL